MTEIDRRDQFRDRGESTRDHDPDDDYYSEDTYSPWKKNRMDSMMSSVTKNSGILLGLIGAVIFILIALFLFMPMLKPEPVDLSMLSQLDERIKKLDARISQLESNPSHQPFVALQDEKLNQMGVRLDSLESALTQKLDSMNREMEGVRKTGGQAKIAVTETPKTEPPSVKKTDTPEPSRTPSTETKSGIRYHVIQPKETLFSIAKMYGLSVDELRRLNKLSQQDLIKWGQKLRVSP
jgi:LysM repeat protein